MKRYDFTDGERLECDDGDWVRFDYALHLMERGSCKWQFVRLEPTGTIHAKSPSGAEYVVKNGDMNTGAGMALLNAMVRGLT